MKLAQPLTGEYDPETKLLTLTGRNSVGKQARVDVEVSDESVFMTWIASVLFEKFGTPAGSGKAVVADAIAFGIHDAGAGRYDASFRFEAGKMRISFVAAIHTTSPERVQSIKAHLEQALLEMGHSQRVTTQ